MNYRGYRVICIIPARYNSTRLPAKALADINGKPMVQYVYENAEKSGIFDDIIVATDDKRIFNSVKSFGGKAVITSARHKSGTDRVAEAAKKISCDIVVNIQCDEPFLHPVNVRLLLNGLLGDSLADVSTLAVKISACDAIKSTDIVKTVVDSMGYAMYFSRSVIPFNRDNIDLNYYKHIGIYAYRKPYLMRFVKMKESSLERAEKLEQLRILENGGRIRVVITRKDSHSVDTEEDLIKARKLSRNFK